MENLRQLMSVVADGLLHYKLNLDKWVKDFNVARALKRLFTPALNIPLKRLESRGRLITRVDYFNNIYKILINIIN